MRRASVTVASIVFLSACAHAQAGSFSIGPAPVSGVPAGVSFAGTWTYNPDDSDRPGQGFGRAGGRFGNRGGGGGFGGFGGEDEGGGGGREGRGDRRGGAEVMDSTLRQPPRRLVITQSDSTLTVSPNDSVSYTLFFDGRDVVAPEMLGGTRVRLSGHWHNKQFEVAREMTNGAVITQSYQVTRHGQRLVVHVQISRGSNQQVMPEFQIVYDRYQ